MFKDIPGTIPDSITDDFASVDPEAEMISDVTTIPELRDGKFDGLGELIHSIPRGIIELFANAPFSIDELAISLVIRDRVTSERIEKLQHQAVIVQNSFPYWEHGSAKYLEARGLDIRLTLIMSKLKIKYGHCFTVSTRAAQKHFSEELNKINVELDEVERLLEL